ncbi:SRPBCC family protein [Rhodospirillum sp. A1_3_36]|uniref:SRPBCC family protein n=1 Tax=Rhodospirillum sp. A1_3_36 TaxID=3391666 RepID=UPI0039A57C56
MSDGDPKERMPELVFEVDLDAPPEVVWRALHRPDLREAWLPKGGLVESEPVFCLPGREICYRMRDEAPPHLESQVTFQVRPGVEGGATLRIVHRLADPRLTEGRRPLANDNGSPLMRVA